MGLDIFIRTDSDEMLNAEYLSPENVFDNLNKHSLSRTFCTLMCRKDVIEGEPELDQIGRLFDINITPLYDMNSYPDEEWVQYQLTSAETNEESILKEAERGRRRREHNIDKVYSVLCSLIDKLSHVDNLPGLLLYESEDQFWIASYFADFNTDRGQGYIGNNFGQDMRNFKRFLEYEKSRGTKTVYFIYG